MSHTPTKTITDLTREFLDQLDRVLDHFWLDEERDFDACDQERRNTHVFESLRAVRGFLVINRGYLLRDDSYNGWSNYETWAVNLWLNNSEEDYLYWRDSARQCRQLARTHHWVRGGTSTLDEAARHLLADQLRAEVTDGCLPHMSDLPTDLLSAALAAVDWHEVADGFLEDLDGCERLWAKAAKVN